MNYNIILIDTVYFLQNTYQVPNKDSNYFYLSFNEILTLLLTAAGIIIAICQFITQMNKNRKENEYTNKRNWYVSVIVIPQIESINIFYNNLINNLINSINNLNNKDLVLLSKLQADNKDDINAFFDHLQSLVKSYDINISKKISDKVLDLEDCTTKFLSDYFNDNTSISKAEIRRIILLNKKEIISILYTGI